MKRRLMLGTLLMAFMSFSMSGCYGPFKLTKSLHRWNGEVAGKWPREGVFLLLVMVPVYSFSALADAIVFNSIEFWTGDNPIASSGKSERVISEGDDKAVLTYAANKRTLDIVTYKNDVPLHSFRIEPSEDGGMQMKDEKGEVKMFSKMLDKDVVAVKDDKGRVLAKFSPEEADRMFAGRFD